MWDFGNHGLFTHRYGKDANRFVQLGAGIASFEGWHRGTVGAEPEQTSARLSVDGDLPFLEDPDRRLTLGLLVETRSNEVGGINVDPPPRGSTPPGPLPHGLVRRHAVGQDLEGDGDLPGLRVARRGVLLQQALRHGGEFLLDFTQAILFLRRKFGAVLAKMLDRFVEKPFRRAGESAPFLRF